MSTQRFLPPVEMTRPMKLLVIAPRLKGRNKITNNEVPLGTICAILVSLLVLVTPLWAGQAEDALNEALKLHESGNPKEALALYDKAIKANPKLADAYFNRGNAHYDL